MVRSIAETKLHTDNTRSNLLTPVIVFLIIIRLAFVELMGIMPQDAYYSLYGQYPALSYFDHPSGIAWVLKGATAIFGKKGFALKLADTVVTTATVFAFYQLAAFYLSLRRSWYAILLLYASLMITVLSLVSTPDVPLMLCWTLTLLCLSHAIFRQKNSYWIWTGIFMAMAFNSKYTAIFLPIGIGLFLCLSKKYRHLLATPWPWICGLITIAGSLPVIVWNLQHNFASLTFQSSTRAADLQFNPLNMLGMLGHQALLLLPVLFGALIYFTCKAIIHYRNKHTNIPADHLFLLCFFAPMCATFLLISPVYWVKLNWIMPAYLTGIIWISRWINYRTIRWQWISTIILHVALAVEIIAYPVRVKSDDVWLGWKELATAVKTLQHKYPNDFIFSADSYKTSAVLSFYLDSTALAANVLGRPALQFDYIGTDLQQLEGRNALFINSVTDIDDDEQEAEFAAFLQPYFTTIMPLQPIIVRQGNRIIRKFLVYRCQGYRPPPLRNN